MNYFLNGGKPLENIPVIGMISKQRSNRGEVELTPLAVWIVKGKENRSDVTRFLDGIKFTLRSTYGSGSENIAAIVPGSGKELSVINSERTTIIDGEQVLLASSFELSKVVFVKSKDDVEHKEELIKGVRQIIANQYPIPMEDEWSESFISMLMETSIEKLTIHGVTPYSAAYFVSIPTNILGQLLAKSYGKSQFQSLFGRAPKLEEIWLMIDPTKFNVKTWQPFAGSINFESLDAHHRKAAVHMYEIFGEKTYQVIGDLAIKGINYHAMNAQNGAISLLRNKGKNNVDLIVKALNIVLGQTNLRDGHMFLIVCSLLDKVGELDLAELVKKPSDFIANLRTSAYSVQKGGEQMALVASELWFSDQTFMQYQEAYIKAMAKIVKSPRRYPTVSGGISKEYTYESMDMGNPRGWVVGLETNCCQHLNGAGGSCVKFAAEYPENSGIFRVMKNGNTIAQSWFWYDDISGSFVFDNIEVLGQEVRDSILECYISFIENELKPRAKLFGYKTVSVGLGYNDVQALTRYDKIRNPVKISALEGGAGRYSDAGSQVLLASF